MRLSLIEHVPIMLKPNCFVKKQKSKASIVIVILKMCNFLVDVADFFNAFLMTNIIYKQKLTLYRKLRSPPITLKKALI